MGPIQLDRIALLSKTIRLLSVRALTVFLTPVLIKFLPFSVPGCRSDYGDIESEEKVSSIWVNGTKRVLNSALDTAITCDDDDDDSTSTSSTSLCDRGTRTWKVKCHYSILHCFV